MHHSEATRSSIRAAVLRTTIGLLLIIFAIGILLARSTSPAGGASTAAQRRSVSAAAPGVPSGPSVSNAPRRDPGQASRAVGRSVTLDDGVLPKGVTVLDDEYPGVARLEHDLRRALRAATADAAADGIELDINSGWRSPGYQDALLRDAVAEYGSLDEAARWVATADTSPHVSGAAVDIGSAAAVAWLAVHGAAYDLCQIYRNEPWHYELRTGAFDRDCPPMYADPTQDPRLKP